MTLSGSEISHTCEELTSAGFPGPSSFCFASHCLSLLIPSCYFCSSPLLPSFSGWEGLWGHSCVPSSNHKDTSTWLPSPDFIVPILFSCSHQPRCTKACAQVCPSGPPNVLGCQLLVTVATVDRTVICIHSTHESLSFHFLHSNGFFIVFNGQVIFKKIECKPFL